MSIQTKGSFLRRLCSWLYPKTIKVPPELLQAINDCTSTAELIELLFATDLILDEAMIAAFDNKFDQFEQQHTISIYQTLKPQLNTTSNGNRTV
ncbi:hypothetical protein [Pseudocnuella soli]|uniref:hypothetical protein n=1 Tax=Pseudocnuella soli TaxID=2502779 RepID=UPI0010441EF8|nr:hypothetical protein [Pseudocnuella soli]